MKKHGGIKPKNTKDEKRKAKKEKLVQTLNAKKEAQQLTGQPQEQIPFLQFQANGVRMGDLESILMKIDDTVLPGTAPTKEQQKRAAIDQMAAFYQSAAFNNDPTAAFSVAHDRLDQKTYENAMRAQREAERKAQEQSG